MLFNLLKHDISQYDGMPNVQVFSCDFVLRDNAALSQRILDKMVYFKAIRLLRQQVHRFKPDFLHAHYACSFGLIGALAGFHPYVLSVWGSDVYNYPRQGSIYRHLLTFTLKKSDYILSTSHCMARETNKYTPKPICVTPFGVDMLRFAPMSVADKPAAFVVGNVKTLKHCYGIDTLIRAFAIVHHHHPKTDMRLLIAGTGPDKEQLETLCNTLGIRHLVDFLGYIPNAELPKLYAKFDVSVSLSREESFGVVAVEAMSCGCPVVTSDAEGFCEVVNNGVTGYIVPKDNPEAAAEAIVRLIDNPQIRASMATAARQRVAELYDWERNVDTMMAIYQRVIAS